MLVIKVTMLEGRTEEQREALHAGIARAAVDRLGFELADVRTAIYEVRARNWGISGRSVQQRREDAR